MAAELQKHFKMGDHVKVISGRYEGDTGLIVRVEDNMVVLFADLTMHEVGINQLAHSKMFFSLKMWNNLSVSHDVFHEIGDYLASRIFSH